MRSHRKHLLMIPATALAVAMLSHAGCIEAQSSAERVRTDVRYLADDAREGRGVGTAGLDSAAAYIARQFQLAGLTPAGNSGYFQAFTIDSTAPAAAHMGLGGAAVKNVVGLIPGRGTLADQTVVLGAHYDHLGFGGANSLDPDSVGVVHNGADDNASGTAVLMEVARILSTRAAEDVRTIVFVAFTAEELGVIGSDYYVKHPVRPNETTYTMLNFDMVGRLSENDLIAMGTGSAREMPALIDSINARNGLVISKSEDPWGSSDQTSFYGAKIPVLHLFTDTHPHYHRTADDWDKIDYDGAARIAWFASDLAWTFATRRTALTFEDVPQQVRAMAAGHGASLGTIPDMSSSPGGVRLNGVRAGGPADQAGMRAGDILIQLGEHEVKDLYGMTAALAEYYPGDEVKIVVIRDGQRVELTATLGQRGG